MNRTFSKIKHYFFETSEGLSDLFTIGLLLILGIEIYAAYYFFGG